MRAALKHSAGHRSKDKRKLDGLTENRVDAKNEDGENFQISQFLLCPFLQSSYDVPGQLLLVIAERNSSNYQSRGPFHRLQSESLNTSTESTRGLVQKNPNIYEKMSSNNYREADDSISPWRLRDHLDEFRRPSVNKTCLSSNARHREKINAPETTMSIARNQSNQTPTASNKKRWEYLWTGRRPTGEAAYKFQHYSDIRRYMEQYRQDHVHRGTPSPDTKNEEPFQTSTLSICSIDAPLERPLQDLIRPFLAPQRLPSNHQTTTELYQQRKRRTKSGVSFLGFRGHLHEQDSVKDTVGRDDDGAAGDRCISSCRALQHPNGRCGVLDCVAATAVVIGGISLPWCNLRVASRRDSGAKPTDILPDKRKSISDSSKERPARDAVIHTAGNYASSRSVTVIDVTEIDVHG